MSNQRETDATIDVTLYDVDELEAVYLDSDEDLHEIMQRCERGEALQTMEG